MSDDGKETLNPVEDSETPEVTIETPEANPTPQQPVTPVSTPPPSPQTTGQTAGQSREKIELLLKPVGGVLIMKKHKWAADGEKKVGWVANFIHRGLKCAADETIFLYVNQTFAPAHDVRLSTLYDCFGSDGRLVLHYCQTPAWG